MIEGIKKQFRMQWGTLVSVMGITFAAGLIGIIFFNIMILGDDSVKAYFQVGTVFGIFAAAVYSLFAMLVQMPFYFNLEISMGCTRKYFFVSFFIVNFLGNLLNLVLLLVINCGEKVFWAVWCPTLGNAFDFGEILLKWGIPAVLAITIVGEFLGALLLRYGRKAGWVFWTIWMVGCIGYPRISKSVLHEPDSLFGKFGNVVIRMAKTVPAGAWIGIAAVFSLGCFAGTFLLIRKQAVKA